MFCSCAVVTTLLYEMADRNRFPKQSDSDLTKRKAIMPRKQQSIALNVFRDYLKERKIDQDSLVASKDKLATILRKFYAEDRKKKGLLLPQKN